MLYRLVVTKKNGKRIEVGFAEYISDFIELSDFKYGQLRYTHIYEKYLNLLFKNNKLSEKFQFRPFDIYCYDYDDVLNIKILKNCRIDSFVNLKKQQNWLDIPRIDFKCEYVIYKGE